MTDGDPLLVDHTDGVATLTFNRPEKLNAFSGLMGDALCEALRRCDGDDGVRALIITGAGRAFCSGADFSAGGAVFSAPTGDAFSSDPLDDFHPWECRKPVIAAINGPAVGLGLTMALQCDIRVVAADARLGIVQNRRGILPDARSHWTLPRLVGHARAAEILLTGRMFTGVEAERWGLASAALPAAEVLPAALEMARDVAINTAPLSVAASKRLLWMSGPTSTEIDRLERELHLQLMGTADSREGVQSFMEKRSPKWSLSVTDDWPGWLDDATLE